MRRTPVYCQENGKKAEEKKHRKCFQTGQCPQRTVKFLLKQESKGNFRKQSEKTVDMFQEFGEK